MKNLNKKIGAVALAGMMVLGGFVGNVGIAQANGPFAIHNKYNIEAHNFIHNLCHEKGVIIVKFSDNPREIDEYIKANYPAKYPRLVDRSVKLDRNDRKELEEYIDDKIAEVEKGNHSKLYRIEFGIRQYLVLFPKSKGL